MTVLFGPINQIIAHWTPTTIIALMVLHKLASGPGTYDLATVLCLSEGVRRRPGYLRVHAIRGRGLPNADDYSAMDPYVKIEMTTPHQPNMETGQDNMAEGKTKPALEAGMHPTWNVVEHKSVMDLRYDAPLPLNEKEKKDAEHAAWLLGNEDGLCDKCTLHVEVVDFDFVGDHDEVRCCCSSSSCSSSCCCDVVAMSLLLLLFPGQFFFPSDIFFDFFFSFSFSSLGIVGGIRSR